MSTNTYTNENIEEEITNHYDYYLDLFNKSKSFFDGILIFRKRFPDVDGYDKSYFHIITKEYNKKGCNCPNHCIVCEHPFDYNPLLEDSEPREICPHRIQSTVCLTNYFNKQLLIWKKEISRGGLKTRICCYSQNDDYLIVLEERKNGEIYFVTGYPVEYSFRRNKLMKQYNDYIKEGNSHYTETISL